MATATPRMPAEFSDDLSLKLHEETRDGVPADQRLTCQVHLGWRDHCRSWH